MTTKRTIKLKRYVDIMNEYPAAGAVLPGMLVELTAAGTIQAQSTAVGPAIKDFALEDELQGKTPTDAYVATDPVFVWTAVPGSEVNAILADGQTIVIGDKLTANGDGSLKKIAAITDFVIGIALEAVVTAGATSLIGIRIS